MNEFLMILGMAFVTFIPRYLPFALASRLRLPRTVEQALAYVPIAVLTVIIVQSIFYRSGVLALRMDNPFIWASLCALIVALLQKILFVTILCGLASYSVLKFCLFA